MFRNITNICLTAAAAALFTACINDRLDGQSVESADNGRVPIRLTTGVAATRAAGDINGSQFASGEDFMAVVNGVSYTFQTTDASGTTKCTSGFPPYFSDNRDPVTIQAYYPASLTYATTEQTITVSEDQSQDADGTTGYKDSDLMYGVPTTLNDAGKVVYTESAIPIQFTHRLSKIKIVATTNGATIKKVEMTNVKRAVGYTPSTNALADATDVMSGNTPQQTVVMYDDADGTSAATLTCAAIIPPQQMTGDTEFITVTTTRGLVYSLPDNIEFKTGQEYTYNLSISDFAITATVTVNDWDDAENGTDFTPGDKLAYRSKLPIEYVAPYNMKSANEMATDNHVEHSKYFYWGTTSPTPSSIANFINGTGYLGYHLPSTYEWMAILPPGQGKEGKVGDGMNKSAFDVDGYNYTRLYTGMTISGIVGEEAAWGVINNAGTYTYEVHRKFYHQYNYCPETDNVSYAIRFMEDSEGKYGIYTCAYRFTYNATNASIGSNSLTIDVKYIGLDESITLSTISQSSWWSDIEYTVVMPTCGWLNNGADADGSAYSSATARGSTYYWSATPNTVDGSEYGYCARFYPEFIDGNMRSLLSYSYSIRLFHDRW